MKRSNCDFVLLLEKYSEIGGKMGGGSFAWCLPSHVKFKNTSVNKKKTSVFGCHTFIDFLLHSCFNEMPGILNFPLVIYFKNHI